MGRFGSSYVEFRLLGRLVLSKHPSWADFDLLGSLATEGEDLYLSDVFSDEIDDIDNDKGAEDQEQAVGPDVEEAEDRMQAMSVSSAGSVLSTIVLTISSVYGDSEVEFKQTGEDDMKGASGEPKNGKSGRKRGQRTRRPGTKEEKELALAIHNLHVLANLSHYQLMSHAADDPLLQVCATLLDELV